MSLKLLINIGFVIMLSFASCNAPRERIVTDPLYFDIVAIIDSQVQLLDSLGPEVKKELTIQEKTEVKTLKVINWKTELEPFKEADLNTPILRDQFIVSEEKNDTVTKLIYKSKNPESKGISKFIAEFDKQNRIKSIQCEIGNDNILFSSRRKLVLNFIPFKQQVLLTNYSVVTERQLLFDDKEKIALEASVVSYSSF